MDDKLKYVDIFKLGAEKNWLDITPYLFAKPLTTW